MSATEMNEQEITDAFEEFISKQYMDELGKVVNLGLPALIIDFCELDRFDPTLTDFLIDNPKNILAMFERAAKNIEIAEESEFKIRFTNFPDDRIIKIRDIRSANIGKLIAIEGLIRQASDVRPVATLAVFECPACGTQIEIIQNEQIMKEPAMCSCGRKGRFKMLEKKLVDTQRVVVEESTENIGGESQPRRLGCFLTEDLVEPKIEKKTAPGTRVTVIGIVRELPIIERGGSKTTRFDLIMEANNLDASEHEYEELDIQPEDVVLIKEMAANPEIYTKLTNSIAPSIYGYEGIKESIALQMFGGVQTKRPDHTKVRGDIHILLVGDPGVAKSQLLKYVSAISPKARYVSGKGASGAGITASVIKDEFLHGWSLEAGALVLANHGICCLAPETKIISDNQIINIESLFNKKTGYNAESNGEKIEVCDISAEVPALRDNIIVNAKATKIRRKNHTGKMLELTFSDGNKILLTPDHKLINGDNLEWSKAENFATNQHIVSPLKIPAAQREITIRELIPESWTVKENNYARKHIGEKLKVDVITPKMAYLFGFIYGDGHVKITNRNSTIAIYQSTKSKKQIKKIKDYWDSFSFRPLKEYIRKTNSEIRGKNFKSEVKMLYAGSNLVAQIYNQLCGQKLRNILMMPQEQLKAFVSGLIDSDGCISVKHKGDYKTVAFDLLVSNDLETCSNLVTALKRFDVYSRLRPARNVISIQSTGRQDIKNLIEETKGYSLKTSMLKLPKMLKDIASESDVVSKEKTAFICNEISKLNKSLLLSKGVWSTVYNLKHKQGMPTRSSLRMFRNKLGNYLPKELVDSMLMLEKRDIFLNKIVEIKETKYNGYVYDLYVPGIHNFVANGIIVHNCIDEIDKMEKDDRVAMHEAMEQQTVTISKANIHSTLKSETTILAAANPKLGRFDPYQPIGAQIDMPPTLLSRFDLIFAIRDMPNKENDEKLATHILESFRKPEALVPEIAPELMKKYIAYAKKSCHPKLTTEAINELKNFFVGLRSKRTSDSDEKIQPIPLTARQLEAMVRLSQASARVRLSELVTKVDAQRAINMMKMYLQKLGVDYETGEIDIDRIVTGITSSQRNRIMTIKELLKDLEGKYGSNIPIRDLVDAAKAKDIEEAKVEEIIDRMKRDGELFEPKHGIIRRMPK